QPGGNVTGFQAMVGSLGGKWMELLKEIAPRIARVAMLFNPAVAPYAESYLNPIKAAASSLAVEAIEAPVRERSSRPGPGQVRTGDQPHDRQGSRPHYSAFAARPRRRGDRITCRCPLLALSGHA